MKKYVMPSFEIEKLETTDVIMASNIVDNGQSVYKDENGNTITGQKASFSSRFESIF